MGTMETVTDFIFLGSKITANGDCSREIRKQLLLGMKVLTKLDSVLKSKEELESVLMRVKEESEKSWLTTQYSKS